MLNHFAQRTNYTAICCVPIQNIKKLLNCKLPNGRNTVKKALGQ